MSIILTDQDGVMTHWGKGYGLGLDGFGSLAARIARHEDQRSFNLKEGLTAVEQSIVDTVMSEMSYIDLEPMPGAVEALHSMVDYGHEVLICTSPWYPNPNCVKDKIAWVDAHLGHGWADRVIITKDKTMIRGDVLIDDKPDITGRYEPVWSQVLFDQPYNKEVTTLPRLLSWADWKNEEY